MLIVQIYSGILRPKLVLGLNFEPRTLNLEFI